MNALKKAGCAQTSYLFLNATGGQHGEGQYYRACL